jgi:hypothetical protein
MGYRLPPIRASAAYGRGRASRSLVRRRCPCAPPVTRELARRGGAPRSRKPTGASRPTRVPSVPTFATASRRAKYAVTLWLTARQSQWLGGGSAHSPKGRHCQPFRCRSAPRSPDSRPPFRERRLWRARVGLAFHQARWVRGSSARPSTSDSCRREKPWRDPMTDSTEVLSLGYGGPQMRSATTWTRPNTSTSSSASSS